MEYWDSEAESRFSELVDKEALGTVQEHEFHELEDLQRARRSLVNPPDRDEMVARLQRDRLDRELLRVLKSNVSLAKLPKNPA